jgi:putative transposase
MPDWPHAPIHRLDEPGAYMVTAGTYHKKQLIVGDQKLSLVQDTLFSVACEFRWQLQAWAILANHYHFVAISPTEASTLRQMVSKLHTVSARGLNRIDCTPGRRVWFQYWDSRITYERSYLARLNYVHHNPVHHGLVATPPEYPWCSAAWFVREADPAFRKTVAGFKTDRVSVPDDF